MDLDVPVPITEATPLLAAVLMLQVMVSLFASVAWSTRLKGVGADMVTLMEEPSVMIGASSTAVTVTTYVCVDVSAAVTV